MYKIVVALSGGKGSDLVLESESKGLVRSACKLLTDNKVGFEVTRLAKEIPVQFKF